MLFILNNGCDKKTLNAKDDIGEVAVRLNKTICL